MHIEKSVSCFGPMMDQLGQLLLVNFIALSRAQTQKEQHLNLQQYNGIANNPSSNSAHSCSPASTK
jgi:hypothetical protein